MVMTVISGGRRTLWFVLSFSPLFALAAALMFAFGSFDVEMIQSKLTVVSRFAELAEGGDSSQRIHLFSLALQMWFESLANFLVGGGVGTYPQFIGETEPGWYPHNFILESVAEGGLIAGLFLLWIFSNFFVKLIRLRSQDASLEHVFLGALAMYALISYQFMGGVQTFWIPSFFVALFLFSQARQTK